MLRRSTWIGIHLYLAVQIAAPASYYLWGDEQDERFAWRMFSTTRNLQCVDPENPRLPPRFALDGLPVPLHEEFHEAWIKLLKRGRSDVVDAMGVRICKDNPGRRVSLSYLCIAPGEKAMPPATHATVCEGASSP